MIVASTFSRREMLKRFGTAGVAALALPELSRVLLFQRTVLAREQAQGLSAGASAKAGEQPATLTAPELATLAAVCARVIPTDENGPGATEAQASRYIDRALGGLLASSRGVYSAGLASIDEAARQRSGRRFVELSAADQDAVLTQLQETPFFTLVRTHTIQGTFCDPVYGGNANFAGWDLIAYPGVRLAVTADDQRMATPAKPIRRSAYEYAMFANTLGATHAH
jgi:gluconate 2-dehydrogenase gamma chain